MNMNERDIVLDLLTGTKYISLGYHNAVLEAANDRVRNTLIQLNNDEMNMQKQLFDIAHDRNWYPVEPAQVSGANYRPMTSPGAGVHDPLARSVSTISTAHIANQPGQRMYNENEPIR